MSGNMTVGFYVTGGTVPPGTPSYVERQADRELFEALSRGEFCYVLTSRQMGKSSLMAHTTACLREAGVTVVNLDLTRLGQNLTVEQWYDGLLGHIGRQLGLEDELEQYWLNHERLSPLQRWLGALHDVVLARVPGPLVIAVDEIDTVRSLPFSPDEFFAAIRDCYNRRGQDPEFARLTFCLLGVASPSDLIQDTRTTPFNIGRRIELVDFTVAEAAPLARGLGPDPQISRTLLQRIIYWTGGHPYLTQRLCQVVATEAAAHPKSGAQNRKSEVDRCCEALFLSHRARERDDNLLFVRDQLLRSQAERASLLSLYARVRSPRDNVPDDETDPLVSRLRLSGLVSEEGGRLRVRNRIYARVFDARWVQQHMPDAELRRLRALAREEARRRRLAETREQQLRRSLYVSDMNLAQQAWDMGSAERVLELLEAHQPGAGQEDLRGFEWRHFWRACQEGDALLTWSGHPDIVLRMAFSPDGAALAAGCADGTVALWDVAARQELGSFEAHQAGLSFVGFAGGGRYLVTADESGQIRQSDLATRQEIARWQGAGGLDLNRVALSP